MEVKLDLDNIDPIVFYGVNEQRLDTIRKFFPKIKLIARGHEIKILGERDEVQRFSEAIELINAHFAKYN